MNDEQRIATAQALADAIVAAARIGGSDCPIPSCPTWTMKELVAHVAPEYACWYYANLTADPDHPDPVEAAIAAAPPWPEEFDALVDYLEAHAARFCAHAGEVDLNAVVWAYDRAGPARFWLRMAIAEIAAHAWDAAMAVGHPSPLSQDIALEAVDQFTMFLVHRGRGRYLPPWTPPAQSLRLMASDAKVSWRLNADGDAVICSRDDHADAAVRVTAPAESLYLGWFGRDAPEPLHIDGDPTVFYAWRSDP